MTATSSTITHDLAALDGHIQGLQARADGIALAAVSGDEDARKQLASLLREIDQVKAERPILEMAREQALLRESEAGRAVNAADRQRNLAAARDNATRLLDLGKQADDAIAAFCACMEAMDAAERGTRSALRAAGEPIDPSRSGCHQIAAIARERMEAASTGKLYRLHDKRSVTEIISSAWADVIEMEDEDA